MRKRISPAVFLLVALFLAGCAGQSVTPIEVMKPIVISYEGSALALNTWKAYIKGQELGGSLKPPELDSRIAEFEKARMAHRTAGDWLLKVASSPTEEAAKANLKKYNEYLIQVALEMGKAKVPDSVKANMTAQMQKGAVK
jgi:hypothetical protein